VRYGKLSGLTVWNHKAETAVVELFLWLLVGTSETVDMHGSGSQSVRTYLSPSSHGHPSVFFGVSNYHSERWDRRQIFNRQAITGVNTVPLHLLQIQGTVTAHTGALLTQWNRPGAPSGGHTDCRLSSEFGPHYVIRMLSDTSQICVRLLLLIPSHYATSVCLPTKFAHKNPNYLTRTISFPGVYLYLLPRLGLSGLWLWFPLFLRGMNKHNSTFSGMLISHRK